jgi:hypothetical protein
VARPRRDIDYDAVRDLVRRGWGTRRIARKIGASRSLIYRVVSGQRPEFASTTAAPMRPSGAGGVPARRWGARACPLRPESDRQHAKRLLQIARCRATDEEFAAAERRLGDLLDSMPEKSAYSLASGVARELNDVVSKRERAAAAAERERSAWVSDAERDLEARWTTDARLETQVLDHLEFDQRRAAETALDDERERAQTLLARRLNAKKTGALTERLIDRLVANGLKRARRVRKLQR